MNPNHFRAKKLLGSALSDVGEYKATVMALTKIIYVNSDCTSSVHAAIGDDADAFGEFQKAIDLRRPGHGDPKLLLAQHGQCGRTAAPTGSCGAEREI